ncbi:putative aquaporin [Aspergillus nomiae NRRL 13137]|uniref:Putative aquaporin n=1 Tax=Aspergillus nomiae NRRL (strain ATCC 15546 / NRRL 13137 / CBS 260.88 / M93) TaxID=1509407 RepID=A0A0L1JIY6_ASPN3|nr:putative aquaporin [Aspergillus nomiae NRRL 13137]KNG91672.1 putative aquaporin [Aspergillus nomiae NRRL 13137]
MPEEQDLADGRQDRNNDLNTSQESRNELSRTHEQSDNMRQDRQRPPLQYRSTGSQRPSRYSQLRRRQTNQTSRTNQTIPSLAGPREPDTNSIYIHPEYHDMNPDYGKTNEEPVWGLAKPLPRVVRPGMRRHDGGGTTETSREKMAKRSRVLSRARDDTMLHQEMSNADHPDRVPRPVEDEVTEDGSKAYGGQPEHFNKWSMVRHQLREPFAEWLGTTVAMLIGLCATLAISTGGSDAGNKLALYWAWGLAITVGIYIAGGISGGHLNPAISIALWIYRGFPGRRCIYYVIAQILGALTAGGLAYCIYRDSIFHSGSSSDSGITMGATGLSFYTEPLTYVRNVTAFFNEFVAAAILICTIFAMGDDSNAPPGAGMHSFIIGLLIFVLAIGFGYNTGGCFNPARDLGPRLVALMAGYGGSTFTERGGWWFWGAWLATISGALAGGAVYDVFIFIGGESPINYPRTRRRRSKLKKEAKWRRRLNLGRQRLPSIEEAIKELEE